MTEEYNILQSWEADSTDVTVIHTHWKMMGDDSPKAALHHCRGQTGRVQRNREALRHIENRSG